MRFQPGAHEKARLSCDTVVLGDVRGREACCAQTGLVCCVAKRMTKLLPVHNLTAMSKSQRHKPL